MSGLSYPFPAQYVAGGPETILAATFTDSDKSLTPAAFAATIHWGDGTSGPGTITEDAQGTFSVSGVKTYAKPGAYPVTVTVGTTSGSESRTTAAPSLVAIAGGPVGNGSALDGARGLYDGRGARYVANHGRPGVNGGAGFLSVFTYYDPTSPSILSLPAPASGVADPTGLAPATDADGNLVGLVVATSSGALDFLPLSAASVEQGHPVPGAASIVLDNSASGADYEGIATGTVDLGSGTPTPVALVANFATGKIEVYDVSGLSSATPSVAPVDLGAAAFVDPSLPAGYAPFNVQEIGGTVYVAYAKPSGIAGEAIDGAGDGVLAAFDAKGAFLAQYGGGGLNAPWGITLAGSSYGPYAGDLLVANTGDGTIQTFAPTPSDGSGPSDASALGFVLDGDGTPTVVGGLWGLATLPQNSAGIIPIPEVDVADDTLLASLDLAPFMVYAAPRLRAEPIDAYTGSPAGSITVAQLNDLDGAGDGRDAGQLSATIDWGDGSAPTAGTLTFAPEVGPVGASLYLVGGTHHYDTAGSFTATVTVAMAGGSTDTVQVPVTVVAGDPPPPVIDPVLSTPTGPIISMFPQVPATATASTAFRLGSISGPTANYTLAIDWGDGSAPTFGQVVSGLLPAAAGTSSYTLTGSHLYNLAGTYTVTVNLLGPGGVSEWALTKAVVSPAHLLLVGDFYTLHAGQGQPLAADPLATFTFDGAASVPTSQFAAAVDWGDGSAPTFARVDLVQPPGGTVKPYYAVDASHIYTTPGAYTPHINVIAADGESQWATDRLTVVADKTGPTIAPVASVSGVSSKALTVALGTFQAPAGSYTAAVDWGDGTSASFAQVGTGFVLIHDGVSLSPDTHEIDGTHTYASPGTYQVTVNLRGPGGTSTWAATSAVVAAAADGAATDVTTTPFSGYAGIGLTADRFVAFTGAPATSPVGYRAAIDWGDGTAATFGTVGPFAVIDPPPPGLGSPGGYTRYAVGGSHTYAAPGTYKVTVDILAPDGSSTWTSTTASIAQAPAAPIDLVGLPTGGIANAPLTGEVLPPGGPTTPPPADATLAVFYADPRHVYTAAVDWGDGSAPTFGTVERDPTADLTNLPAYEVHGTHIYTKPGTYTARINLLGPAGSSEWAASTVSVGPGLLSLQGDNNASANAGLPTTGTLATFQYASGGAVVPGTSFTAAIDWGDGTAPTLATVQSGGTTTYSVNGSHTYRTPGTFNPTINVIAPDAESVWAKASVVVSPAGGVSDVTQGSVLGYRGISFRGALAGFVGGISSGAGYRAAVDWGDGSAPTFGEIQGNPIPGILPGSGPPAYTVYGTHAYAADGTYKVTVNILAPDGSSTWTSTTATVTDPPSGLIGRFTNPLAGSVQNIPVLGLPLAGFAAIPASYTVAIDWGDDTAPSFGILAPDGEQATGGSTTQNLPQYLIEGAHTFARAGNFTATINIKGPGGLSEWFASAVKVEANSTPSPTLAATAGQALSGNVAVFQYQGISLPYPAVSGYSALIDWGDGSAPVVGAVAEGPMVQLGPGAQSLLVSGSHTFAKPGTYVVGVELTAPDGETMTTTTKVVVAAQPAPTDLAPVAVKGTQAVPIGGAAAIFGGATLATFSVPAGNTETYTAAVDWGDGSAPTFGSVETLLTPYNPASPPVVANGPDRAILGGHTYIAPGTYKVTVNLIGSGGDSQWVTTTATIAANPNAPTDVTPLPVSGTQAIPIPYAAPVKFNVPDPSAYKVAVDWGDGSTPTFGTVTQLLDVTTLYASGTAGPLAVTGGPGVVAQGDHTYVAPGTYKVTVDLIGPDGESIFVATTATIAANPNAPTDVSGVPISGTQGVLLADPLLAQFNVPNLSTYQAVIDWGDGSTPTFGTVAPIQRFTDVIYPGEAFDGAFGSHTYTHPGVYPVTVDLLGPGGESVYVGTKATIAPAVPTVTGGLASAEASAPGLTYNATPTYSGTAPAGTVIGLYALPIGASGPPTLVGSAIAGADGSWSITSTPLLNGSYNIAAYGTSPYSGASAPSSLGTLTVAPDPAWLAALASARQVANGSRSG